MKRLFMGALAFSALFLVTTLTSAVPPTKIVPVPYSAFRPVIVTPEPIIRPAPLLLDRIKRDIPSERPSIKPVDPKPKTEVKSTPKPQKRSGVPTVADAKAFARRKLGPTQYACIYKLFKKESNWRTTARNSSSGAYGIPQALPGSKMGSVADDWRYNPLTQVRWGIIYVTRRYGSACGAWNHSQREGWY